LVKVGPGAERDPAGGARAASGLLGRRCGGAAPAAAPAPPAPPHRFADRTPAVSLKDVLIGVSFLLALGAFVLSVRNARQLRRLAGERRGLPPPSAPLG
jgi:hypothetical protein